MSGPDEAGSFFGRRRGKRLRDAQEQRLGSVLPMLRVDLAGSGTIDPAALFPDGPGDVWLEIGFGGGEHLVHLARSEPGIGLIGVEAFVNGVAKLMASVEADNLRNVRVHDDDVAMLLGRLRPASLGRVYLLYPDPWPKRRQRKRRLLSDATLTSLARVMRPGAELRFATDIDDYAGWALARVFRSPDFDWAARGPGDWERPWAGWPGTRYEAKARREGRGTAYLTFTRRA